MGEEGGVEEGGEEGRLRTGVSEVRSGSEGGRGGGGSEREPE